MYSYSDSAFPSAHPIPLSSYRGAIFFFLAYHHIINSTTSAAAIIFIRLSSTRLIHIHTHTHLHPQVLFYILFRPVVVDQLTGRRPACYCQHDRHLPAPNRAGIIRLPRDELRPNHEEHNNVEITRTISILLKYKFFRLFFFFFFWGGGGGDN